MLLTPSPAWAKHPTKDIPLLFIRLQPHGSATTLDHVQRTLEMTNRAWANAGLRFTFNPSDGFLDVTDNDLNCWGDNSADDIASAQWWANSYDTHVVSVHHWRMAPAEGKACVATCTQNLDCCPDDHDANNNCVAPLFCNMDADNPIFPSGICAPAGGQSGGPRCFVDGSQCTTQTCELDGTNPWAFVRYKPLTDFAIVGFPHELGHHFGLWHTFDPPDGRCYDRQQGTVHEYCNALKTEPAVCSGAFDDCEANSPYRNVMSYFADCTARFAGGWSDSGWNQTLSPDQIGIVWRSLDELYDKYVTSSPGYRVWNTGAYESMQAATSTGTTDYYGYDLWNYVSGFSAGDAGWVNGHVNIVPGDFNGDGLTDALVAVDSGSHPGVSLWIRQDPTGLTYQQTLIGTLFGGSSACPLAVGNVTGDGADDALITCNSTTFVFRGSVGGSSMTWTAAPSWGQTTHKVLVGNLGGTFVAANMPPGSAMYHTYQDDVDQLGRYDNLSYDDMFVLTPSGAQVYYGANPLNVTTPDVSVGYTYYASGSGGQWAANLFDNYHDELVLRWGGQLRIFRGQDTFSLASPAQTLSGYGGDPVVVSLGDFWYNQYADFLQTTTTGTTLFRGSSSAVNSAGWSRADLTSNNTRHAAGDFIRGGNDDVMFFTTSGSWLYAGHDGSPALVENVWSNTNSPYRYPNVKWFGRQ